MQRASTAAPQQLGPNQRITGTGRWQTKAFNFTARGSAFDARLTFAVAGARSPLPHLQLRDVAVQPLIENPIFLMLSGRILQPAHHPNFGHDPDAPLSVYLRNAQDSDSELGGDSGSSFVTMGSDLVLPPGASVTPGLTIRLRTENWNLDQRAIAAVNGNRIDLSSPSTHQMRADWGYFLLGAEWMVDGPDEWFFNGDTRSLRVFMPDGAAPGNRVMLSNVLIGIDLHGLHDVVVEDLDIRGVTTGLLLDNSRDVIVRRVGVTDTRGRGISLAGARDVEIESTVIRRTGLDAINACVSGAAGCGASNIARNNRIEDSGVLLVDGKVVSLPAPQDGAIALGPDGTETGNRIARSGLRGIFLRGAHTVTRNAIVDACLVLDDCGGIYGGGPANGSNISGNVIVRVHGNTIGTPIPNTRTAGVYVDELGTDMLVEDNVVMGADRGIQVHNAFSNVFRNNLLYGNRRNQLWLQEDTNILRSNGDLHTNVFDGNVLVALEDTAALRSETDLVDVHDFGSFTGNIYSTLFGRTIVTEAVQNNEVNLDFPAWQDATANGVPRNSDATGRSIALQGFAAFQVTGDNLVPNGDLDTGLTGWATFSSANPSAQLTLAACATTCAHVSAGGGTTLLSTPYFSVKEDQWYRVSFDAATDDPDREITVLPRRGGGGTAGFEPLGPTARTFPGSTTMKRYSFTFRAAISVTANDPVTGERGARIDFLGLQPGQGLTVSNVEMVPIGTRDIAMATALLVNDDPQIAVDVPCPDESSAPLNCGAYVKMLDGTPVNFPLHLEPLQAEAVYTRDSSLVDTDSDGIPDEQDQCSLSPPSEAVNAAGCALDQ
ncbi:MAG: right-handed parallel beta-helix repeat-containing protein [Pirellulaceae bacterium]